MQSRVMSNATPDTLRTIRDAIDTIAGCSSGEQRSHWLDSVRGCIEQIPGDLAMLDDSRASIGTCHAINNVQAKAVELLTAFAALCESVEADALREDEMGEREHVRQMRVAGVI